MKILIADDEELVRVGLCDILSALVPAAEIIEAVNGRELISLAESQNPDICFTDIRMPGISGLEAIEQLTGRYSGISWIILSGYSDFDYARRALSLGVLDYLLKPATEEEVSSSLEKAVQRMSEQRRQKREKFEYRISGVLNNSSAVEFDDYLLDIGRYCAMVFIYRLNSAAEYLAMQKNYFSKLRGLIDESLSEGYAGLFIIPEGYPAVIAGGADSEDLLKKIASGISPAVSEYRIEFSPLTENLSELLEYLETKTDFGTVTDHEDTDEPSDKSARIVRHAEKLVMEQYNEPIGVAQIAEQLNLTPNYLSSLFKKYNNESFTKFITDIRLKEAPKILDIPGITVKDAASRLGYMSSRHFTRLFREKYGMPPSDYCRK